MLVFTLLPSPEAGLGLLPTGSVVDQRDVDCVDEGCAKLLPFVDYQLLAEIVSGLKTDTL